MYDDFDFKVLFLYLRKYIKILNFYKFKNNIAYKQKNTKTMKKYKIIYLEIPDITDFLYYKIFNRFKEI